MKRVWNDDEITKALKKTGKPSHREGAFDHVWFKIEDKIAERKHFWSSIIWRPWGHPVKWVMAATCLTLVFSAVLYREDYDDQKEMASYLTNLTASTDNVTNDRDMVKVSVLLSEPSTAVPEVSDEEPVEALSTGDIFL